ncbi:MAG: hypothetical protein NZ533_03170 [Casimicrobiaceae bacterium]|nr:hypothetical protein [Casimicrobiaceae bacterium]MCX8097574.1 hypothetical protein [Casimicrobiaceae bacterium]MDW8313290.1 hypothetical protein [Burkholderiales bacterium]
MEIKITLTPTAQRLIRATEFKFSTDAPAGMAMPAVGDLMRVTLDEPPVYLKVIQRAYDFTTSPVTVSFVLGAPD